MDLEHDQVPALGAAVHSVLAACDSRAVAVAARVATVIAVSTRRNSGWQRVRALTGDFVLARKVARRRQSVESLSVSSRLASPQIFHDPTGFMAQLLFQVRYLIDLARVRGLFKATRSGAR